jgi:hypothetical protein
MSEGRKWGGAGVPRYPPFAQPAGPVPVGAADPPPDDDYPLIEQFLDELPAIDDYLEPGDPAGEAHDTSSISDWSGQDQDDEGWAISEWQSYDWHGLASLGMPSPERAEADAEWGVTEWSRGEQAATPASGSVYPSSEDVAAALNAVAARIRSGELPIDQFRGTPPEAAIAAALASVLKMRR